MACVDLHIRSLNLIFLTNRTLITEWFEPSIHIPPSLPYLRIKITPSIDERNIAQLDFWYSNPETTPSRLNETLHDKSVFQSLTCSIISTNVSQGNSLVDRVISYILTLPQEEVSVITKEYSKYIETKPNTNKHQEDPLGLRSFNSFGILLNGFISGIAAYIVFLLLNENSAFINQLSFQISTPSPLNSGTIFNRHMFQYLSLPFTALSKVSHGLLLQLVVFIQSFINIWEPVFIEGPSIEPINEARIAIEVLGGFSNYVTGEVARANSQREAVLASINSVETRLQTTINDSLTKLRREINNLVIETRHTIGELTDICCKQVNGMNDSVKEKIAISLQSELNSQIKEKVASEIENTQSRIGELVNGYMLEEGRRLITDTVNQKETELEGKLIGLEHRIEILYNKLDSATIQKSPLANHNQNIDGNSIVNPVFIPQPEYSSPRALPDTKNNIVKTDPPNTTNQGQINPEPEPESIKRNDIVGPPPREIVDLNPVRRVPIERRTQRIHTNTDWLASGSSEQGSQFHNSQSSGRPWNSRRVEQ